MCVYISRISPIESASCAFILCNLVIVLSISICCINLCNWFGQTSNFQAQILIKNATANLTNSVPFPSAFTYFYKSIYLLYC